MKGYLILLLCLYRIAIASTNQRVLVIVDDLALKQTNSKYFKSLEDAGFQLDIKTSTDSTVKLFKYDELIYNSLVLMAPKSNSFGSDITINSITNFIDAGGNVLVVADSDVEDAVRTLAIECGLELDDKGNSVIDHFNHDAADGGAHTRIVSKVDNLIEQDAITGGLKSGLFLYEGIGIRVDESNPLSFQILSASDDAFSYKPGTAVKTYPFSIGKETTLIGSTQARNNARITFVGSMKFFSNEFLDANIKLSNSQESSKSANEQLAIAVTKWTFKELGVLRVTDVRHQLIGSDEKQNSSGYTVTDDVKYSISIEKYENGKWLPFAANDMQLEFIRIDPFVRQVLKADKAGNFVAEFKIPDVYGVFTFTVNYRRVGYTYLYSRTQVTIRPFRHTQYERFIYAAYPYYAAAFSMMFGVFCLSVLIIGTADDGKSKGKTD